MKDKKLGRAIEPQALAGGLPSNKAAVPWHGRVRQQLVTVREGTALVCKGSYARSCSLTDVRGWSSVKLQQYSGPLPDERSASRTAGVP